MDTKNTRRSMLAKMAAIPAAVALAEIAGVRLAGAQYSDDTVVDCSTVGGTDLGYGCYSDGGSVIGPVAANQPGGNNIEAQGLSQDCGVMATPLDVAIYGGSVRARARFSGTNNCSRAVQAYVEICRENKDGSNRQCGNAQSYTVFAGANSTAGRVDSLNAVCTGTNDGKFWTRVRFVNPNNGNKVDASRGSARRASLSGCGL